MQWDTIFAAGTHTDSSGQTNTWTRGDLNALVENTPPDVPVVIGHPDNDRDASHFAKIARLRRLGDKLQAKYRDIPKTLKKAVSEGLRLGKSVSIDRRKMALRHLGLLGADQPPAVDGLGPAHFTASDEELLTYSFGQQKGQEQSTSKDKEVRMEKDKKIAELVEQIAKLKADLETLKAESDKQLAEAKEAHEATKEEFAAYKGDLEAKALDARVDALVNSGRIMPHERKKITVFAKALPASGEVVEFEAQDGTREKVSPREMFLRDFESRPADKDGLLSEFARDGEKQGQEEDSSWTKDVNNYA